MAPRFSWLGASSSSLLAHQSDSWQPLLALLLLLALVGLLLPLCGSSGKEKKKKRRRHHGDASDNYYDDYYDDYEEDSYGEETNYRGRTRGGGGRRNDHRQGKSRGSPRTLGGGGRASDKRETTVGEEKSIGASYYTALLKKNKVKSVSQYLRKF